MARFTDEYGNSLIGKTWQQWIQELKVQYKSKGISQKEIAEATGKSKYAISNFFRCTSVPLFSTFVEIWNYVNE
jgi:predicted transcriptional regulator